MKLSKDTLKPGMVLWLRTKKPAPQETWQRGPLEQWTVLMVGSEAFSATRDSVFGPNGKASEFLFYTGESAPELVDAFGPDGFSIFTKQDIKK